MKTTVISISVAFLFLICLCVWSVSYRENVTMPKAYQAWCKQTGNEKNLSYEEWRDLLKANTPETRNTIIFLPR